MSVFLPAGFRAIYSTSGSPLSLVHSLLVSPAALVMALGNGPAGISRDDYYGLCTASGMFARALPHEVAYSSQVLTAANELEAAVTKGRILDLDPTSQRFAHMVSGLPTAYYAMGRARVGAAVSRDGVQGVFRERLVEKRVGARPVGLASPDRQRVLIGNEERMIDVMWSSGCLTFLSPEDTDSGRFEGLLHALGMDRGSIPGHFFFASRLEEIWGDRRKPMKDRQVALVLWCENLLDCLRDSTDRTKFLVSLEPTAKKLWDIYIGEGEDMRDAARQSLGRVLALAPDWAPAFMDGYVNKRIRGLWGQLPEGEVENLLNLSGGIIARSSSNGMESARFVDGVLAFLDFAADRDLAPGERARAFAFGLWAVEKFVPHGAQAVHDWVRWQVEGEEDPHVAAVLAHLYCGVFTATSWSEREPATPQQAWLALQALRRKDLETFDRSVLWENLRVNQPPWIKGFLGFARRFGRYADPKASASSQRGATASGTG